MRKALNSISSREKKKRKKKIQTRYGGTHLKSQHLGGESKI
jgi:hypothetical protein